MHNACAREYEPAPNSNDALAHPASLHDCTRDIMVVSRDLRQDLPTGPGAFALRRARHRANVSVARDS